MTSATVRLSLILVQLEDLGALLIHSFFTYTDNKLTFIVLARLGGVLIRVGLS